MPDIKKEIRVPLLVGSTFLAVEAGFLAVSNLWPIMGLWAICVVIAVSAAGVAYGVRHSLNC